MIALLLAPLPPDRRDLEMEADTLSDEQARVLEQIDDAAEGIARLNQDVDWPYQCEDLAQRLDLAIRHHRLQRRAGELDRAIADLERQAQRLPQAPPTRLSPPPAPSTGPTHAPAVKSPGSDSSESVSHGGARPATLSLF